MLSIVVGEKLCLVLSLATKSRQRVSLSPKSNLENNYIFDILYNQRQKNWILAFAGIFSRVCLGKQRLYETDIS